jgi:hypothetical protein
VAKTWVLDTETKGTGAQMVPYEKALRQGRTQEELALVELDRPPRPPQPVAPPEPLRFKVVSVMSSQAIAEGVSAREAVRALEAMRSVVDARIFLWVTGKGKWRLLTLDESKALWAFRGRLDSLPPLASG